MIKVFLSLRSAPAMRSCGGNPKGNHPFFPCLHYLPMTFRYSTALGLDVPGWS